MRLYMIYFFRHINSILFRECVFLYLGKNAGSTSHTYGIVSENLCGSNAELRFSVCGSYLQPHTFLLRKMLAIFCEVWYSENAM